MGSIRTFYSRIGLIAFLFFVTNPIWANYIAGGEITYRCVNAGTFEITLKIIRDCEGAALPTEANIGLRYANGSTYQTITSTLDSVYAYPSNKPSSDSCVAAPAEPCRQVGVYVFTTNLPYSFGGYHAFFTGCCRNPSLTNYDFANSPVADVVLYTHITLNGYNTCNDSPVSDKIVPLSICQGAPFSFDLSATDANQDSIAYRLCAPKSNRLSTNNNVFPAFEYFDFAPGFSVNNFMGGLNPISINETTGLVTGTAPNIGTYQLGFCIDEYREGAFLGTTQRDFQMVVAPCAEANAFIDLGPQQCGDLSVLIATSPEYTAFTKNWTVLNSLGSVLTTNTNNSFEYTFPSAGTYSVVLILNPGSACADTAVQLITLIETQDIGELLLGTAVCSGGNGLQPIDVPSATTAHPDLASYNVTAYGPEGIVNNYGQTDNISAIIESNGQWIFELTVNLDNGCVLTTADTAVYAGVANAVIDVPDTVCYSSNNGAILTTQNIYNSYNWSITNSAGQVVTTTTNDTATVTGTGLFTAQLIVGYTSGCKDTIVQQVTLLQTVNTGLPTVTTSNCVNGVVNQVVDIPDAVGTTPNINDWDLLVTFPDGSTSNFDTEPINLTTPDNGIYSYTLTTYYDNGCVATRTRFEEIVGVPISVVLTPEVICNSTNVLLVTNAQSGYFFNWNLTNSAGVSIFNSSLSQANFSFPSAGNYTATVITSGSGNGCPDTAVQNIEVVLFNPNDLPLPQAATCINGTQSQVITTPASVINTYDFESYSWTVIPPSGGAQVFDNQPSFTLPITVDGTYTYQFNGTVNAGCSLTAFQFVDYNPIMTIPFDSIALCAGDTIYLNPSAAIINELDNVYTWSPASLVSSTNDPNPFVILDQLGNQSVNVTITNSAGCTYTDVINLFQPSPPYAFNVTNDAVGCQYPINVTVAGNAPIGEVLWSYAPDFSSAAFYGATLAFDENSVYPVYFQSVFQGGCLISDSITEPPFVAPDIDINFVVPQPCFTGDQLPVVATVSSESAFTLAWLPAGSNEVLNDSTALYDLTNAPQNIQVEVTNADGCTSTANTTLPAILELPWTLDVTADPDTIELGQTVQLDGAINGVANITSYAWQPVGSLSDAAIANPVATPTETTTYVLEVTEDTGCKQSDSVTVLVVSFDYCQAPFTQLPTAFSPNGDGTNDVWRLATKEYVLTCLVTVYNRWGEEVFIDNRPDFAWDGKVNDDPAPSDSYTYVVTITCTGGYTRQLTGNLLLLR